jgi:hypothetical protein
VFGEYFFIGDDFGKVTLVAELSYYVGIIFGGVDVKYLNNILAVF